MARVGAAMLGERRALELDHFVTFDDAVEVFDPRCEMSELHATLLVLERRLSKRHPDLVRESVPAVGCARKIRHPSVDACTMVHLACEVDVIASGYVSQHVPLPLDANRIRVVRIGGLAHERERVTT